MSASDTPTAGAQDLAAQLPPADSLLLAVDISKSFGGLHAVTDVTFWIPERGIVSIIGPNGAGKTTFFNMLTGLYKPTAGLISYRGKDITGMRPDRIMAAGVARTFQNIRLFGTMTALENVLVGEHARMKAGLFGSILRTPGVRKEERVVREKATEMLEYVGLPKRDPLPAGHQPGLRRPAARGDRPGAGLGPGAAAARRADRGHERRRVGPLGRARAPAAR